MMLHDLDWSYESYLRCVLNPASLVQCMCLQFLPGRFPRTMIPHAQELGPELPQCYWQVPQQHAFPDEKTLPL